MASYTVYQDLACSSQDSLGKTGKSFIHSFILMQVCNDLDYRAYASRCCSMLLRSNSYAVRAAKLAVEAVAPNQAVQLGSASQEQLALPVAVTSPGSKLSKKRSRAAAPSTSASSPVSQLQPEQPVVARKTKPRKALLNTLWSAEELIPLKTKTDKLYNQLNQLYADPPCPLDFSTPFQLLVAVILSAQVQAKLICQANLLPQVSLCQTSVAL